jgi:glycosyltransferase involved in cell wall biosynthesis
MTCSISIIIPTLNAGAVLEKCLASIAAQNYPKEKIEVLIVDAGSIDRTLEIVRNCGLPVRLLENPLKTGEAGKAVGLKYASGEIIAFIDSDNELPGVNWLQKMTAPFADPEIFASDSLAYTYQKDDTIISRYAALTANPDPVCNFTGNYTYYSYLSQRWTLRPVMAEDKGDYWKVKILDLKRIPTFGANGFMIRANILKTLEIGDYYFDIDVVQILVRSGCHFLAKVKTSIGHHFCRDYGSFIRKQLRRIRDYQYFQRLGLRHYSWGHYSFGYLKFLIYTLLVFPLIFQTFEGFFRKRDAAWFFHPVACWTTLLIYTYGTVTGWFYRGMLSRRHWKQ